MLAANRAVAAQVSVQPLVTSVEWARIMVRRTQTGVGRSCAGCRARCELVESRMQRCVAIVWTRAGLPHDGCVDCDVCEYSVVDGLARYIVRILSYRRLTPQICTRSRETLCTRPTLAGTPNARQPNTASTLGIPNDTIVTIPWRTFTASNLQRATPKRYHIQSNTTAIRYHSCISSDRDTIRLIDQARARGIASVASVRSATTRAHAPVKIRVRKEKRRSVDNDSPPPSHPTGTGAPSFEFWLNARHYGFCTHAASIKQNSAAP